MGQPRFAVLNASHEHDMTSRNFRRELPGSIEEFELPGGDLPPSIDYDGIVVTGSSASVYWDEPWIEATKDHLREALAASVPTLGVCWGHQLLADALGGTVEDMGRYEIGYREITHDGTSDLFAGIDRRFTTFTSHSDAVVELPPGTRVTAENDLAVQGFAGDRVWGVQFHPEYDMETARSVTAAKEDIDPSRQRSALESITEDNFRAACQAKQLFDNFVALVAEG